MSNRPWTRPVALLGSMALTLFADVAAWAQLIDRTTAPNEAQEGIAKSLGEQIGAGRGTDSTPESSLYLIARDPFRAIRRGRQLFQRKFTRDEGQEPGVGDGRGNINVVLAIGAGVADSSAACHGRPRGAAGFGGVVVTRPDSRDAPHLFGLGLKEMLADEITADLRELRSGEPWAHALVVGRSFVLVILDRQGWVPPRGTDTSAVVAAFHRQRGRGPRHSARAAPAGGCAVRWTTGVTP